jgi:cysteine desulfurase
VDALRPYLVADFGNPSSGHSSGQRPRAALEQARTQIARLIAARPDELVFTGSGSEADSLAIRGAVLAALVGDPDRWTAGRPHVMTQVSEHPAVLKACEELQRLHGVEVTHLPVDDDGFVDPSTLEAAITAQTVLVTVMHANNETGVIQPIADLAAIAHAAGALFHTDAAQTVGKIGVDVDALGVDLLTMVGHKMYAPKGIAALYLRDGVRLETLIPGGGQERGLRSGTENVALAVALGAAAELARSEIANGGPKRLTDMRDQLQRGLERALPGRVHVNGHKDHRLPHTLNVSIDGTSGDAVLALSPDLAASTGSACHTGVTEPSPVLTAMGLPAARGRSAVRLSLGRWTTNDDIVDAVDMLSTSARAAAD